MSIEKFANYINSRNENRRKEALIRLVKIVETQIEKTHLGESSMDSLREKFETYRNLKQIDKLQDLKKEVLDFNNKEGEKAATEFLLINHAVKHDYKFELN